MTYKPLISFDYAIKYLLKDKGGYEIIEGFISALFAAQGYKPVKIKALLDPESNKESKDLKRSVADLVVEDQDGNNYIVEIERSLTQHFAHKSLFNTSRLVVDSIGTSQDYTNIKKIFHISLLYFDNKEARSPIYHGKTIVHEIDTAHPATVRIANEGLVMFENYNVFPEYFFIWVPLFNDVVHKEIDEWLYVMKHSDVREDFKSPYMAKVAQRLSVLKMNDEERNEYFKYLKDAVYSQDVLAAAREEGEAKGEAIGVAKGKAEGEAIGVAKGKAEGEAIGVAKGKAEGEAIGAAKGKAEEREKSLQKIRDAVVKLLKENVDEGLICKAFDLSNAELAAFKQSHNSSR